MVCLSFWIFTFFVFLSTRVVGGVLEEMEAFPCWCFFLSLYEQCFLWRTSYKPLTFQTFQVEKECAFSINIFVPHSGWTVTEPGLMPLTFGNEAQRVMALYLQCNFSLFDPMPRAKAVWLFPTVPKSGDVTVRACWIPNYQPHIDKFTPVHLIFLFQLWQSCENRIREITKDFAVLYTFRTSILAFG